MQIPSSFRQLALMVAVAAASAGAAAQQTYVAQSAQWGAAQEAAVKAAGGVVRMAHAGAGVAVIESSNPDFLAQLGGAAGTVVADQILNQAPVRTVSASEDFANPVDNRFFAGVQWAPQAVRAPEAWAMGYTGKGVRVAVIDGGIFAAHPDLAANVDAAAGRSFVPGAPGSCEVQFNCDTGTFWHGTHVAGIVAAVNNGIGVVGIAPEATIVPVKALHSGSGSFASIIQAVLYAATDGRADIINMSLGAVFNRGGRDAAELTSALNRTMAFAARNGVLVISSAGNDAIDVDHSGNLIVTPAESGNGLAISSTGPEGFGYGATNFRRFSSYSNYGSSMVSVAGPGGDFNLFGTPAGNANCTLPVYNPAGTVTRPCWVFDMVLSTSRAGYSWAAGTSMSAPAASAVAALIKQKNPGISVGALKNRLAQSADDEGKPGADPYYGRGFVNALNAVSQ